MRTRGELLLEGVPRAERVMLQCLQQQRAETADWEAKRRMSKEVKQGQGREK